MKTFNKISKQTKHGQHSKRDLPRFRSAALPASMQHHPLSHETRVKQNNDSARVKVAKSLGDPVVKTQKGWEEPVLTKVGLFYPLGPRKLRFPKEKLSDILQTLQNEFRKLSLQVFYQNTPISAECHSLDQVGFVISIFECNVKPGKLVVEVERRSGDAFLYHNYANQITSALGCGRANHFYSSTPSAPCFWKKSILQQAESIDSQSSDSSGDDEDIEEALESVCQLISNDRFDTKRLGLLSLLQMTDPNKSGLSVSIAGSKYLLLPRDTTQERVSRFVIDNACEGLSQHFPCPSAEPTHGGDMESDIPYLCLAVMTQAFQVASEYRSVDLETFLSRFSNTDLIDSILEKIHNVHHHPHCAYYAVQSLVALCDCVPSMRSRVSNRDVEEAQLYGDSCHLALATASHKLLHSLRV